MIYKLVPSSKNIIVVPLKPRETKEYTSKVLADVETSNMDIIQYGRVIVGTDNVYKPKYFYKPGDIVLYQKLASHRTNFGDPRQVIVPMEYIEASLEEIK